MYKKAVDIDMSVIFLLADIALLCRADFVSVFCDAISTRESVEFFS
jgi:hypothetical protein